MPNNAPGPSRPATTEHSDAGEDIDRAAADKVRAVRALIDAAQLAPETPGPIRTVEDLYSPETGLPI